MVWRGTAGFHWLCKRTQRGCLAQPFAPQCNVLGQLAGEGLRLPLVLLVLLLVLLVCETATWKHVTGTFPSHLR